ncbi:hypothetical protein [Streptomyces roseicoloratus]|uniref:Uncharacterized protein n=1 Tax=Streptomyces roseicoloratus TaxID=2508722 RepID=A0ABY9RXV5_9ACTN|nr:hypothetical protein [Streptomyces roseicoloratus]WMX45735.1 hypothetical protein RGF97_13945 [Streptomyces roseicoloratus]
MTLFHRIARRTAPLAAMLGTSFGLPLAVGATPAHAVPQLEVSKFHSGSFARGGTGPTASR